MLEKYPDILDEEQIANRREAIANRTSHSLSGREILILLDSIIKSHANQSAYIELQDQSGIAQMKEIEKLKRDLKSISTTDLSKLARRFAAKALEELK
jgi:hypothetical protein